MVVAAAAVVPTALRRWAVAFSVLVVVAMNDTDSDWPRTVVVVRFSIAVPAAVSPAVAD